MFTQLDSSLFRLIDAHPEWLLTLSPEQRQLMERRRSGATLNELAGELNLTKAGVRLRLYGKGNGLKRSGGILGELRRLFGRKRRALRAM
ncbi:MAG TPA: hypothetical protein VGK74_22000 [Symbiobacteriaceae bacterium]